jgi:hypothetical protein
MTDPTYQLAELESSRQRWKTTAIASWLFSALLALGVAGVGLQWHAEMRRARMQAEQAALEARARATQRFYVETIGMAERQLEEAKEPPASRPKD